MGLAFLKNGGVIRPARRKGKRRGSVRRRDVAGRGRSPEVGRTEARGPLGLAASGEAALFRDAPGPMAKGTRPAMVHP
ncbi:hypothetical protein BV392_08825 [Rhodovulum sulfidophilum]|nr:hypothetical protein BV392_08825 [Rhodovulum sulfidophilum]